MKPKCNETRCLMDIIETVTIIANHDKVKEKLEPNLFIHRTIDKWAVRRVLYAYELFLRELDKKGE